MTHTNRHPREKILVVLLLSLSILGACMFPGDIKPLRKSFSLDERIPWNTSKVVGTPGPPDTYRTEVAFKNLAFSEPLEFASIPGTDRLLIAERYGKLFTFSDNPVKATSELLIDLKRIVYGAAVHPNFLDNRYIFVTSIVDETEGAPTGTRVSRFKVSDNQPFQADIQSETVLIEWPSGGHNGGCLRFGPDGYLYIATGDGSGIADQRHTGQDLTDLLAALLRIDVDREESGLAYAIPEDNPFIDTPGARPEIWAYGLRQVWKYSWDEKGNLWAGDVGQDLWEEINLITRGGNYGWSLHEGSHPFHPERRSGPTEPLPAVIEFPHSEFRSITGGYVYSESELPELKGSYIYGDYDTGQIWAMRHDGQKVLENFKLADTELRIIAFGVDNQERFYIIDFMGKIHRLVKARVASVNPPKFPHKLSETGLFTSTQNHIPAEGLIPYSVNSPLWSDGAKKERFLALPGKSQIEFEKVVYPQPAPGAPLGWLFPPDTVLVKTFSLEMEKGNPETERRLETRLLHLKSMPGTDEIGAQYWRGYTYLWNDEQTDADLIAPEGLDRTYRIVDSNTPDGVRYQEWRYPSRSECQMCHTYAAKYALGLGTRQMNKAHDYDGVLENQISTLAQLGVFKDNPQNPPSTLPSLVDYRDKNEPLGKRARSYLHANCSHCHRKWGGGNADFQLLYTLPLREMGLAGIKPAHGTFGLEDSSLLSMGNPERSLLLHRMKTTGLGRMPHIASNVVDEEAVKLISAWIEQMPESLKNNSGN
jgi:uncharacterized repeat protein (TIGR03806 family)